VTPAGLASGLVLGGLLSLGAGCGGESDRDLAPAPQAPSEARPAPPKPAESTGRPPPPETVVEGLDFPTAIAFTADGRMLVSERAGRLRVVKRGRLEEKPLAEIPTTTDGERGLLGLAVAPDERRDPAVYAFATEPDGDTNRVLRVPLDGGTPRSVVGGIPGGVYHDGGGVAFDAGGRAQDPRVLGGKIYRYTPAGEVPRDNPFGRSPALAIGLRNPFGLAVDPVSKAAFVTENGPSGHDEVNRIAPGGNYGWPEVSGRAKGGERPQGPGAYRDPLLDFPETIVPAGIAFAHPSNAASGYAGNLFFATYAEGAIHRVRLDRRRTGAASDRVFLRADEPVVALAWGPRGLYYSTATEVKLLPLAKAG
jgi:glucose/arabinose dehydrogenase